MTDRSLGGLVLSKIRINHDLGDLGRRQVDVEAGLSAPYGCARRHDPELIARAVTPCRAPPVMKMRPPSALRTSVCQGRASSFAMTSFSTSETAAPMARSFSVASYPDWLPKPNTVPASVLALLPAAEEAEKKTRPVLTSTNRNSTFARATCFLVLLEETPIAHQSTFRTQSRSPRSACRCRQYCL